MPPRQLPYSYGKRYEEDRETRNAVKIVMHVLLQSKLRDESIRRYCSHYVFQSAQRAAVWFENGRGNWRKERGFQE